MNTYKYTNRENRHLPELPRELYVAKRRLNVFFRAYCLQQRFVLGHVIIGSDLSTFSDVTLSFGTASSELLYAQRLRVNKQSCVMVTHALINTLWLRLHEHSGNAQKCTDVILRDITSTTKVIHMCVTFITRCNSLKTHYTFSLENKGFFFHYDF